MPLDVPGGIEHPEPFVERLSAETVGARPEPAVASPQTCYWASLAVIGKQVPDQFAIEEPVLIQEPQYPLIAVAKQPLPVCLVLAVIHL